MKQLVLTLLAVIFMASMISAGEEACPADRAEKKGYNPFGEFHEILAPVWHSAYPEKDYDALLAAGPKFEEKLKLITSMKPEFKSDYRHAQYDNNLKVFAMAVKRFADACREGDKEKAYELMPDLHNSFEMTASSLLPISYPEFDGFVISFNLLYGSHIPNDNMEGIVGTSETLVEKVEKLTEETIPDELQDQKEDILSVFGQFRDMVSKIKEAADKNAMQELKETATALSEKIDSFVKKYI